MFVVDEMHEFEIGVWKAKFTHLMHILHAAGGNAIQNLNARYVFLDSAITSIVMQFIVGTVLCQHLVEEP